MAGEFGKVERIHVKLDFTAALRAVKVARSLAP